MWMDALLSIVVLAPLVSWSGTRMRAGRGSVAEKRGEALKCEGVEMPADQAEQPHPSPAP